MKLLLFLLGICYFFIFFLLFQKGIVSGLLSLFWQAQLYIILSIIAILYTLEMKKFSRSSERKEIISFSGKDITVFIKNSLKNNIYFLGLILLYSSFYFIFRGLFEDLYIGSFFVVLNIGTLFFYIFSQRFHIFYDLLRGNTILVSFFYSFTHILFLFGLEKSFLWQDYINMILIAFSFLLLFLSVRSKKYIVFIASHALIFFLLEIFLLCYFLVPEDFLILCINIILFGVISSFFFFTNILSQRTYIPPKFFLAWGNILSYGLIILSGFTFFHTHILVFILQGIVNIVIGIYLYLYYKEFGNRESLFFALFSFSLTGFAFFFQVFGKESFMILLPFLFLILSALSFLFPFLRKYILDRELYTMQFIFIGVNLVGVLLFVILRDFSILHFGYLLLFEAVYYISNSFIFKKLSPGK